MEELRDRIWDFLYRADGPKSISEIAQHFGSADETVRQAIQHEWFTVVGDQVTIAYATS
jgi:hypothetical protein